MNKKNIIKIFSEISKDSKKQESYNTGLLGENIIVASYKKMPTEKLEKMRYIINKIIKNRKIQRLKKND